jgi:hypothetical protein
LFFDLKFCVKVEVRIVSIDFACKAVPGTCTAL